MRKAILMSFGILIFLFFTLPFFYILGPKTTSQINDTSSQGVQYTMPYPGILPDHPLYFLKAIRDKAVELMTRDKMEKSRHYLLLSDKRAEMAVLLAKKGKNELGITTFSKGEKYALQIPPLLKASKEQGVPYTDEFLKTLKQSNLKHREMLNMLLKQMPQGESQQLQLVIDLNTRVKDELAQL